MFADVVNQHYEEGDIVWCHDYHLMFLPKCLKEHNSNMKVGWFLHTPFPSSEIHRTLPSRSELLNSVLAADLVGYHTYDYARHFVSACTQILGLEGTPEGVEDQGKLTRVAVFPIGIDSERFIRALELPQVQDHIKELKERSAGRKVMLGVDCLDMIKGIPQKILAFEKFLEENPSWRDKVVLLQIAVLTITDVPEFQKLMSQVHEIVGRICGRCGTLTAVPIHHVDRSLDFHVLCALYAVTDVALVASLRDGMNLVSYEFVACQASKKGVLILSEMATVHDAAQEGDLLFDQFSKKDDLWFDFTADMGEGGNSSYAVAQLLVSLLLMFMEVILRLTYLVGDLLLIGGDLAAQVVGWPPIRSIRKNSLATTSKNNDEGDGKLGPGALFVKASMDGAP